MCGQQIIKGAAIALLFMQISLSQGFAAMNTSPVDSVEAEHIADEMLDSSVLIGIFDCPGNTPVRHLKNGIVPEEQEQYVQIMMKNALIKLNTVPGSPDNFDSDIFVPMPSVNMATDEPLQFIPYPETRWILFLKPGFDNNGKPNDYWSGQLQLKNAEKYLNAGTLFALTDEYHGNVCLAWNNIFEYQPQVPIASESLVNDLIDIKKTLKNLPRGDNDAQKGERLARLNKMIERMKDPWGKAVGEFVKQKKM